MKKIFATLLFLTATLDCFCWDGIRRNVNASFTFDGEPVNFAYSLTENDTLIYGQSIRKYEDITFNTSHFTNTTFRFEIIISQDNFTIIASRGSQVKVYLVSSKQTDESPESLRVTPFAQDFPSSYIQDAILSYSGYLCLRIVNETHGNINITGANNYATNVESGVGISIPIKTFRYTASFEDSETIEKVRNGNVVWSGNRRYEIGIELGKITFRRKSKSGVDDHPIIYADIADGAQGFPLYGEKENVPLYSDFVHIPLSNTTVYCWWDFTQDDYGSSKAYVNGECVCEGHSTTHIIPHTVYKDDNWTYDPSTKLYTITFYLGIEPGEEKQGGSCAFKVWSDEYETYDEAPDNLKAVIVGDQSTTATFRLKRKKYTNSISIEAAN